MQLDRNCLQGFERASSLFSDDSARVLPVRSAVPGVFCAGADLKERRKLDHARAQKYFQILRSTFTALESLSIPTIAVVEGAALGGGLELALACDLRVCGDEAVFGFPETGHGIIPGWYTTASSTYQSGTRQGAHFYRSSHQQPQG